VPLYLWSPNLCFIPCFEVDCNVSCVRMCECCNGGGIHCDDVASKFACFSREIWLEFSLHILLLYIRQHVRCDDCLEDQTEDYQNCSVLYGERQLCAIIRHICVWTRACWFGFSVCFSMFFLTQYVCPPVLFWLGFLCVLSLGCCWFTVSISAADCLVRLVSEITRVSSGTLNLT